MTFPRGKGKKPGLVLLLLRDTDSILSGINLGSIEAELRESLEENL